MTLDEAIAHAKEISENQYICEECQKEHRQLADWLEELKSLREKSKWIPCSERLPDKAFGCLVTVMDGDPYTEIEFENVLPYHVGYDSGRWNDADGEEIPFEVIAWMPLTDQSKKV